MKPLQPTDKAQLPQKRSFLSTRALIALVLGTLIFLTPFFIPFPDSPDKPFWQDVSDLLHAPLFAIPPLVLMPLLHTRLQWPWQLAAAVTFTACATLALLIECLQPLAQRSFSWHDVLISIAGSTFAISFLLFNSPETTPQKTFTPQRIIAFLGAAFAGAVIVTAAEPVNHGYRALQWRQNHFPILADFQSPAQNLLWTPGPDHNPATLQFTGNSLIIHPSNAEFAGAKYRAGGTDWSPYSHLNITLHNPHPFPLHLGIRVDDTTESLSIQDRYQAPLMLAPGTHTFQIPLDKIAGTPRSPLTDLSAITMFSIFNDPQNPAPQPQAHWAIQRLALEPATQKPHPAP